MGRCRYLSAEIAVLNRARLPRNPDRYTRLDQALNWPWVDGWHVIYERPFDRGTILVRMTMGPDARIWTRRRDWQVRPGTAYRNRKGNWRNDRPRAVLPPSRHTRAITAAAAEAYAARLKQEAEAPVILHWMDGEMVTAVEYRGGEAKSHPLWANRCTDAMQEFVWEMAFGERYDDARYGV
jgi:hypothetical protein